MIEFVVLTRESIEAGRRDGGGWSQEQLKLIGVAWRTRKYAIWIIGAIAEVIGQRVPAADYERFLSLKGVPGVRGQRKPRQRAL